MRPPCWRLAVVACTKHVRVVAGGMGYMEENLVTRAYRDWRLISIGGGADEVMLSILSKLQQARFHGKKARKK